MREPRLGDAAPTDPGMSGASKSIDLPYVMDDGAGDLRHSRPGPMEEYYRGLRPEVGRAAIITEAELAALEARAAEADARYEAERWAEKRLDIAVSFMAAELATGAGIRSHDEVLADVALQRADALLARWKETTPEVEPATSLLTDQIDALSPEDFRKGFEAAVRRVDSEGGEA